MLIWTEQAKIDVINFINTAYSKSNEKNYFTNLNYFLETLNLVPNLGKTIHLNYDNSVIKQLIYKKHKIFYLIKDSNIYILKIISNKMDFNSIKKLLAEFLD